jgi:hypothetical protein
LPDIRRRAHGYPVIVAPAVARARVAALAVWALAFTAALSACGFGRTAVPPVGPETSVSSTSVQVDAGLTLGAAGCRPPSPIYDDGGVQGTVHGTPGRGTLEMRGGLGLEPLYTGTEYKIVWRVTGSGPLHLLVTGPDGRDRSLVWGPAFHEQSTLTWPGQEWGAGFQFDAAGCWNIRALRGGDWADVWVRVYAS